MQTPFVIALLVLAVAACSGSPPQTIAGDSDAGVLPHTGGADAGSPPHPVTLDAGTPVKGDAASPIATADGGGTPGSHDAGTANGGDAAAAGDAGGTGDASSSPDSGSALDALRQLCLSEINTRRASVSSPPLTLWDAEDSCTDSQATKGGADFHASGVVTFHKYFGQCGEQYQNEGWYSDSDPTKMITWCNDGFFSEGPPPAGTINHYSNMVNPKAKRVSCGFGAVASPQGGWWMTQDYIEN